METFTLLRRHLAMCGITMSPQSSKNHPFNAKNVTICVLISVTVTLIVVLLNEPNTFDECTEILMRSVTIGTAGVIYVIIVWKTSKLCEFVNYLEAMVNARLEYSKLQTFYIEAGQRVANWIQILHIAFLKVTPIVAVSSTLFISFFTYFTTDLGGLAFELIVPMWFPFDTKNPKGFLMAAFIQYILLINVLLAGKCLVIFVFGTCLMLFPLAKDVKHHLQAINDNTKCKRNRSRIIKEFSQFAQLHSKSIQLIRDYSDFLAIIFVITFTLSIAAVSVLMLLLNIKMGDNESLEITQIINLLLTIFWLTAIVCGICEFGQKLSGTFEELNGIYNKQFVWYSYPCNVQQMLIVLIMVAQKPVQLRVIGNVACDRITLKMVANKVYSYFMVLQRFGK